MAEEFIKFAFSAGELSSAFLGRTDLEKFDLGLREALNYYIDYRGGASVRPGFDFIEWLDEDDREIRIEKFQFNEDIANTYLLILAQHKLRFVQDGAYVTETAQAITDVTAASPCTVTATAHGFSDGDWIKIQNTAGMPELEAYTFEVYNVTTNTFQLKTPDGAVFDASGLGPYTSGGGAKRIYTVTTPWPANKLLGLTLDQYRDEMYITHKDYPPYKLTRLGSTNWTLAEVAFSGNTDAPTAPTITPSSAGTAGAVYAVTAVNADGEESFVEDMALTESMVDITATAGSVKLTVPIVTGAKYYNFYRSLVLPTGTDITFGHELGYIGRSYSPMFTDNNITPDFTKSPPIAYNPFAHGAVAAIEVTAGGSGYAKSTTTVTITTATGSGFIGKPVVDDAGELIGVLILNPGEGYDPADTIAISGAGTGATVTMSLTAATGLNPNTTARIQQRRWYFGTTSFPNLIAASRIGFPESFASGFSNPDSDGFELQLDAAELTPIRHVAPSADGLFVFTRSGVHELNPTNGVLNSSIVARPRSSTGIGRPRPLVIEDHVVYVRQYSSGVKALRPSNLRNYYEMVDLSIYSNHFFSYSNQVRYWCSVPTPFRLMIGVRDDGTMLFFTYVPEHNVYAWTLATTAGQVKSIASVEELDEDRVYIVVQRGNRKFLERMRSRELLTAEDAGAVDSGLETALTYPAASITPAATSGDGVTITASASVFTAGMVGRHLRVGGGRATVASYVSGTEITVDFDMPILTVEQVTNAPLTYEEGDWSLTTKFSTVSGLHHLEGKEVEIFADGSELPSQTVSGGSVSLGGSYSRVLVGLGYPAKITTLPITASNVVLEGRDKRVTVGAIRFTESRGVAVTGHGSNSTYPLKERTYEAWGVPTNLIEGLRKIQVRQGWDTDGSLTVEKSGPTLNTVLGMVLSVEIGDD